MSASRKACLDAASRRAAASTLPSLAVASPSTRSSLAQALWLDDLSVDQLPAEALPHLVSHENSAAGFGERMAAFLKQLIAELPDEVHVVICQ